MARALLLLRKHGRCRPEIKGGTAVMQQKNNRGLAKNKLGKFSKDQRTYYPSLYQHHNLFFTIMLSLFRSAGEPGPRLPVQLRGEHRLRPGGGADPPDGPARGRRHILRLLQDHTRVEVRAGTTKNRIKV